MGMPAWSHSWRRNPLVSKTADVAPRTSKRSSERAYSAQLPLRSAQAKFTDHQQDRNWRRHQDPAGGTPAPFRKTNSLQPKSPPSVFRRVRTKPRARKKSKICSGLATSNGYPPTQSTTSRQADIPRRRFVSRQV